MRLMIRCEEGLMLLRPSKYNRRVVEGRDDVFVWETVLERGNSLFPQDVLVAPGQYEVERVSNPFVPGGTAPEAQRWHWAEALG